MCNYYCYNESDPNYNPCFLTGHWLNHGKEHCLVGVKGNPKNFNRGLDCDLIVSEVCFPLFVSLKFTSKITIFDHTDYRYVTDVAYVRCTIFKDFSLSAELTS